MNLKSKDIKLGKINSKVEKAIRKFETKNIIKRIWEKDPTVWKKDPEYSEVIVNRLGWLSLPYTMTNNVYEISEFVKEVKAEGFTDAVLLGMGGSSMGPEVISDVFGYQQDFLRLHVIDTTDPSAILRTEEAVDISKTLFIVSSKSGTTIEVDSLFRYFFEKVKSVNPEKPGKNFTAITDPETALQEVAAENGFRKVFTNPKDIGGRYSVLSYFGLVPAALTGVDLIEFLKSAGDMMNSCSNLDPRSNPGAFLGIVTSIAATEGRDKLTFSYSDNLKSFGYWVEQLIAESTGKEKKGILPVEGESVGKPRIYVKDRFFVFTSLGKKNEKLTRKFAALAGKGNPVAKISLSGKYDIAGQFYLWEFATAVMGSMLKINPFDEPNVSESKSNSLKVLKEFEESGKLPDERAVFTDKSFSVRMNSGTAKLKISSNKDIKAGDLLSAFLMLREKGDYFAIMAYIDADKSNKLLLNKLRELLREKTKCPVTVGFGPRFLHSTGQYHKGGPDKGMFIQIVNTDKTDVSIPGKSYTFSVLKNAQAIGDYESLTRWKRRVLRIRLNGDTGEGLSKICNVLKKI